MNNLKLNINKIDIKLGMTLDTNNLKSHNFKRLGLLNSFLIKKNPGEKIYWAKNCDIFCFDNEFLLYPRLNTNIGADKMYGTSAYLYFRNNQLNKTTFQLIGNDFAANLIIDKFKDLAGKKLVKANKETGNLLWNNLNDKFIAEKLPNSQHAHFHWIKK